jgi:hypothetical protein
MFDSMVVILAVRSSSIFMTLVMVGSAMAVGAADAGGGDVGFGWRWAKVAVEGSVVWEDEDRRRRDTRLSRALCDRDAGPRLRSSYSRSVVSRRGYAPLPHTLAGLCPQARGLGRRKEIRWNNSCLINQRAVQEVYKALG